jgi:hypothetical protein
MATLAEWHLISQGRLLLWLQTFNAETQPGLLLDFSWKEDEDSGNQYFLFSSFSFPAIFPVPYPGGREGNGNEKIHTLPVNTTSRGAKVQGKGNILLDFCVCVKKKIEKHPS